MIVVDASALVMAMSGTGSAAADLRRNLGGEQCHSPHHIDAEVGHAFRRLAMSGSLGDESAEIALSNAAVMIDTRHEIFGVLSATAWALRHRVSFYDALYVALAVVLDAPLVTADARLTRTPLPCKVKLVAA